MGYIRSNIFANIENKYKYADEDEIKGMALDAYQKLLVGLQLEKDDFKFGVMVVGARLGIAGDATISSKEKDLVYYIFGQFCKSNLDMIFEIIGTEIKDVDYEMVQLLTNMGNHIALPFLSYVLSFAYIDGVFEDDVAERLDAMYGMNFIADFLHSGLEEVPRPTIKLRGLEAAMVEWFVEDDKFCELKQIENQFCNQSKAEIKRALDSLIDNDILYSVDTIVGNMYGLRDGNAKNNVNIISSYKSKGNTEKGTANQKSIIINKPSNNKEINEGSKYFESNRKSVETDDFDYDREYDSIDSLLKAYVDYFEKMVKDWEEYCTYVRNQLDETIFNPFKTGINSINDFKNEIKNTRDYIGEIYVKIAENLCVKAEALCKTTDRYSEIVSVYSFLKMVIEKMEDLNLKFKLEEIETNIARTLSGGNYECPGQMQDLTIKWAEIVLRTPEGRIIKSKIEEKDEILKKIDLEFTKWPELARKFSLEIYTGESDMIERNNKFQKEMDDILVELNKKNKDLEKIPGIYFVQRNEIKKQIKVLEDDLSEKKKLYMEMVDEYEKTLSEKEKEIKTFIKMKEDISSELERLGWKE